jgi:rhodanese-related sulfurtransferase
VDLVEARFEEAHLPGAINIPYDRVDELAPTMLPDKGAHMVVYCSNGPCRNSASRRLKRQQILLQGHSR